MLQLLMDAIVPTTPANSKIYSRIINSERTQAFGIQLISKPLTTAASESTGKFQGSNDQKHWIDIADLAVTQATSDPNKPGTDGGPFEAQWGYVRFCLEKTTNSKVDVFLSQREG